jgi:molybdenum cofactor biosynthesis enzyme MoaA
MKAVVGGNLIALDASKKKLKRAYTNRVTAHLKALEQKEENTPQSSRRQEIIKPNRNKKNYTKNQQNQELVL